MDPLKVRRPRPRAARTSRSFATHLSQRDRPGGFDARLASGHTAEIFAIFAALVIPVLFGAASPDFQKAVAKIPSVRHTDWLLVTFLLLCAALVGLAGASIGLLGLAGDRARKSAQVASAMALYAQATCGFVGLLAAAEVYCSTLTKSNAVIVLVLIVASVAALGCMTVASLLVDSSSALVGSEATSAWIRKGRSGVRHFRVLTGIAWGLLAVATVVKLGTRFSPGGSVPIYAATAVMFFALAFLPFSIFRSLPRRPSDKTGPIRSGEAYLFGLAPALATSVLIVYLPFRLQG
jgi:hypothetical protein